MSKTQKRRRPPARRPKARVLKHRPRPSTGLIRVTKADLVEIDSKITALVKAQADGSQLERRITDGIELGGFGVIQELQLSPQEEKVLSEPVPLEEIRIKPTGQPYLSHPTYTRWMNRAFGRTGWQLVPVGKPILQGKSVCQPYMLHVHRTPIAYAMGEQEYFEGNREQTYGDALEATHASALRRCAKHLGIGLELWDRSFLDKWVADNCVLVKVKVGKGENATEKFMWRRHEDARLPREIGKAGPDDDDRGEPAQRRERPKFDEEQHVGTHAQRGEPITDKQRQRLFVIINNSGRDQEEVRRWLERYYGFTSTKQITRNEYEFVCRAVESRAPLPERRT